MTVPPQPSSDSDPWNSLGRAPAEPPAPPHIPTARYGNSNIPFDSRTYGHSGEGYAVPQQGRHVSPSFPPQLGLDPPVSRWATEIPPNRTFHPIAFASWGQRVGAWLIDTAFFIPYGIAAGVMSADTGVRTYDARTGEFVGSHDPSPVLVAVTVILGLASIIFGVWNYAIRQGKTGSTIGKGVLGIRVVSEATGLPIGPLNSFLRQLAHILDGLPCYIGYLFPLWESKRRTFADMILRTVVVRSSQESAQRH